MPLAPDGVVRSGKQLATLALRELGVISSVETPAAEDLQAAVEHLEEIPGGMQSVTWRASETDEETDLDVIPWSDWPGFDKTERSVPDRYFYDGGVAESSGTRTVGRSEVPALVATLHVHPIPTSAGIVTVYLPASVGNFSLRDTKVIMPRGWALAVRLNLAVKMQREFRKRASQDLRYDARQAKRKIENANTVNRGLRSAEPVFPAARARYPLSGFDRGF